MIMETQDILNYRITSYKKGNFSAIFGVPRQVQDEGSFFRIADLYLVDKHGIEEITMEEKADSSNIVRIRYKKGDVIELGVIS